MMQTLTPRTLPLLVLAALAGPALADVTLPTVTVSADEAASAANNARLPEVTTATRTRTPAKLVPQTIDSVKTEQITAYGQRSLSQALVGVPGVDASGDTRFDGVTIRGFSAGTDMYLDGFRDDMQYTRDLGNIERVEVLKGPAAVLYGRGSSGGIVNRISKRPQKGLPSTVSAEVGSHDRYRLQADLNGEWRDDIRVRLNAAQEEYGSFRNGVNGTRKLFAPSLNWRLAPDLNWLLQYEYNEHSRTPDRGIPGVNGAPANVPLESVYSDTRRDNIRDVSQSLRSRLSYDLNAQWQLRHLLGLIRLDSQFDNTYVTGVSGSNVNRQRWQQDLTADNLISQTELEGEVYSGNVKHQLLLGLDQGWQERNPKLYNNATTIAAANLYRPEALAQYNGAMRVNSDAQHRVRSRGVYAQDQLTLGDWQLLAGLRHDVFHVSSRRLDTGASESRNSSSLSPRLGVVWNGLPAHALYASYSKTFAPVGGSLIGLTPGSQGNTLDPEYTRLYETGIKSDWLGNRVATTLSLYRLELYNRRTTDPADPSRTILTGLQRSEGVELSAQARLPGQAYLRGGVAVQDASLVRAEPANQGKRPANVSKHNGSLFVGMDASQGWFGEVGVTAVGKRFADSANTTVLPGYQRWDARAGYRQKTWDATLAVENLTDRDYFVSATSSAQIMPGNPRQFLLSTRYRF